MKTSKNQNEEKKKEYQCGDILFHKIIYGRFYAKKNSSNNFFNKYTKKIVRTTSANYKQWEKDAMMQLAVFSKNGKYSNEKNKLCCIKCPVILKVHFYNYDERKRDISNYYESIQDLLVDAGIIEDDNFNIIIGHDYSRMFVDKKSPRVEIWIIKADEKAPI